jgi:serine/threonine-protein kinase
MTSAETVPAKTPPPSHLSQSSFVEEGRFVPGTLLAGRYRIVGLLGKGGMGEVYRATDLTLGQSVALKFLPYEAAENRFLLERFHGEVRIARQISHPNVCRVYDIGETEGMPYISMEYVDGEDLASLLPRIGRLPGDRAVATARKICAGIAAAHAKGVIHRDLKPQNIMMDKRGEIVIMDFGLAAIADQLSGPEARNGTPAYMSPEQLKCTEVTPRSDIYALGLVLYEIFTGRKPFDAKNRRELISMQESGQITSMSSLASDIDPSVESVIKRCLDPDPVKRPDGALAVSAALPGGDPLAAALAAGETPSPELVAASGKTEGMPMKYIWLCLAIVVAASIAVPSLKSRKQAFYQTPLDYPPAVLQQKSRDLAIAFGYTKRPADRDLWLNQRLNYIGFLDHLPQPRDFKGWLAAEAPVFAYYRESQTPMVAYPTGYLDDVNPPFYSPGSVEIVTDAAGRLRQFNGVPYSGSEPLAVPTPVDAVFRAADLDPGRFTEAAPTSLPTVPVDTFRAWTGVHPVIPKMRLRVEMGWFLGRLTYFKIFWPWTSTGGVPKTNPLIADLQGLILPALVGIGLLFSVLLARSNWVKERGDRRGAFLVGLAMFSLTFVVWALEVHFAPSGQMVNLSMNAFSEALAKGALFLILYLALEPALRLRWPHSIITWNRVLAGRWSDAQVGSHILIGLALGAGLIVFSLSRDVVYAPSEGLDTVSGLYLLQGPRFWAAGMLSRMLEGISTGLTIFFAIFCLRTLLRRDWAAAIVGGVLFSVIQGDLVNSLNWQAELAVYLVVITALVFALLRFGLLVSITAIFAFNTLNGITLGSDWSAWYAPTGFATIVVLLGISALAFRSALGGRELV